jgi:hypothetical protein
MTVDLSGITYRLKQGSTVRALLVSQVHLTFTCVADRLYGLGKFSQEQRIGFSNAIGNALDALNQAIDADPDLKKAAETAVSADQVESVLDD